MLDLLGKINAQSWNFDGTKKMDKVRQRSLLVNPGIQATKVGTSIPEPKDMEAKSFPVATGPDANRGTYEGLPSIMIECRRITSISVWNQALEIPNKKKYKLILFVSESSTYDISLDYCAKPMDFQSFTKKNLKPQKPTWEKFVLEKSSSGCFATRRYKCTFQLKSSTNTQKWLFSTHERWIRKYYLKTKSSKKY